MKHDRLIPRTITGPEQHEELKHQDPWGGKPWKPGEIPLRRGFSQIPVIVPFDNGRGDLGVQKPKVRDTGYSPIKIVDSEGHEGKVKQK